MTRASLLLPAATCLTLALGGCKEGFLRAHEGGSGGGTAVAADADGSDPAAAFAKPGFEVSLGDDGRIWVFRENSDALREYLEIGEPAKNATLIGAGPQGRTLKGADKQVLKEYAIAKPGFHTEIREGRIWVFRKGSDALAEFREVGEPAKNATAIGKGFMGMSVRGEDPDAITAYLATKPGFYVTVRDGYLWVLREGSDELEEFLAVGEPAKNATLIGKGPGGMSIRSDRTATARAWLYGADGFHTYYRDGRIWVFHPGSEHEAEFLESGEPAKNVSLIGQGPDGHTVRAVDKATARRYLRAL